MTLSQAEKLWLHKEVCQAGVINVPFRQCVGVEPNGNYGFVLLLPPLAGSTARWWDSIVAESEKDVVVKGN